MSNYTTYLLAQHENTRETSVAFVYTVFCAGEAFDEKMYVLKFRKISEIPPKERY